MIEFSKDARPIRFASQFGGLWTDLNNAKEYIAGKLDLGTINNEEAAALEFWIDNGYVILPQAVSADVVDAALSDIHLAYENCRAFVETYEFDDVRVVRAEPRHRSMPHKLLDVYALSENVRRALFSRPIARFLSLIFERPPMAFQGLYFERGSEQPLHQDTAYVRVSHPMELAASWIAFEDIERGTGELEYLAGSHKIPEFLFEGHSKWLPENSPENPAFLEHILRESIRLNLKRQAFLPKKGDALIWASDLAHGGSRITASGTRRSYVTHYCPVTADPMYYHYPPHSDKIRASDLGYYTYSFHGHKEDPYQNSEAKQGKSESMLRRFLGSLNRK